MLLINIKLLTNYLSDTPYNVHILPSGNITASVNQSVTFTCSATCNPQCIYTWTKDGKQVSVDNILELRITPQDEGRFRCTVENGIGDKQHHDVYIKVICKYIS